MKTTPHVALATTCLLAAFLAADIHAGTGPQYWRSKGGRESDEAKPVAAGAVCPGSKEIATTAMKPSWPNGRGPVTEVQVGTRRVCQICSVPAVATEGWANGRGPQAKTETRTPGGLHTCTVNCPPTKA